MHARIITLFVLIIPMFVFSQNVEMAWSELVEFEQGVIKNKKSVEMLSLNQDNVSCLLRSMDNNQGHEKFNFSVDELKSKTLILSEFSKEIQQPDLTKASAYQENYLQSELYANGEVFFYDSVSYSLKNEGFAYQMLQETQDEAKFEKIIDKKGNTIYKSKTSKTKIIMTDEMLKMLSETRDSESVDDSEESKKQYQNESYTKSFGVRKKYINKTTILMPQEAEVRLSCDISSYVHHDAGTHYTHYVINSINVYYNETEVAIIPKFLSERVLPTNSVQFNMEDEEIYILHNNTFVDKEGINKQINHALLTVLDLEGNFSNYSLEDTEKNNKYGLADFSIHPISKNEMIVLEIRNKSFRVAHLKIS